VFEYHRYKSFGAGLSSAPVAFESHDFGVLELVLGISERHPWIDIVGLKRKDTLARANYSVIARDRISYPILEGKAGALNVQLKGLPNFSPMLVEVTFDPEGKLRWPDRNLVANLEDRVVGLALAK